MISHVAASNDGTATASGHSETVLKLTLTVNNPSTGTIELQLNDFSVIPVGGPAAYSWNDYDTAGLTSYNSLFWPIDARYPNEDPVVVLSGMQKTGAVTVQVPAASHYQIVWGAPSSGKIAATFSAP